ncbi:MAG: hypothetical protein ACFE9L_14980 [Candidatus Hodarchaeota archaeon]
MGSLLISEKKTIIFLTEEEKSKLAEKDGIVSEYKKPIKNLKDQKKIQEIELREQSYLLSQKNHNEK